MTQEGSAGDLFGKGIPLTREGLFQLLTDEVYKDGVVENWEQEALVKVSHFLKLPKDEAQAIAARSKTKYEQGELGATRPLDPIVLYKKVIYFIMSDLEIDDLEIQMIEGLRNVLGISDHSHRAVLRELGISIDTLKRKEEVKVQDDFFEEEPLFKDVLRPPSMKKKQEEKGAPKEATESVAKGKAQKHDPVNVNVTWTFVTFEFCVILGVTGAIAAAVNGAYFNGFLAGGFLLASLRLAYFLFAYPCKIILTEKEIEVQWRIGSPLILQKEKISRVVKKREGLYLLYEGDELLCTLSDKGIGEMGWTYVVEHVGKLSKGD